MKGLLLAHCELIQFLGTPSITTSPDNRTQASMKGLTEFVDCTERSHRIPLLGGGDVLFHLMKSFLLIFDCPYLLGDWQIGQVDGELSVSDAWNG